MHIPPWYWFRTIGIDALLRNVTRQPLIVRNERIFPRQAEVVTSQEVIRALAGA